MKPPRTAFIASKLPVAGLALAVGIAALAQANPAHALGGGLTINQPVPDGPTNVSVTGAQTITKTGDLAAITNGPFTLDFTLTDSLVADGWADLGSGLYAYEFSGSSLYTALSGSANILTGSYTQANTTPSILRVYSNGLIEFEITTALNSFPNCYTGKVITGSLGTAGTCEPFLKVLSVNTQTGITGKVPSTDPLGSFPTVGTLLKNFQGTSNAIGSLSGAGAEDKATFGASQSVPSPLSILGAGVAFRFSRRLRQRIARTKAASLT